MLAVAAIVSAYVGRSNIGHAALHQRWTRRSLSPAMAEPEIETPARGFLPFLQGGVPEGQQPLNELRELQRKPFYDWAEDDSYSEKLTRVYQLCMLFVSLPISYVTFDQFPSELPQVFLSANIGTFAFMLPFIARLRFGWGFVSQRLKEREVYYEQSQRGQLARKDRGSQLRDRLIEKEEVAPALKRIDQSLAVVSLALLLSLGAGEIVTAIEGESGPATLKTVSGDEAQRYTNRLRQDDAFARREQNRAQRRLQEDGTGVKPTYCDSRYFKIMAGGNGQGGVGCN